MVKFNQKRLKSIITVINYTNLSSDFESDQYLCSNSDSLESESSTILFVSPNRLSLAIGVCQLDCWEVDSLIRAKKCWNHKFDLFVTNLKKQYVFKVLVIWMSCFFHFSTYILRNCWKDEYFQKTVKIHLLKHYLSKSGQYII